MHEQCHGTGFFFLNSDSMGHWPLIRDFCDIRYYISTPLPIQADIYYLIFILYYVGECTGIRL